MENVWQYLLDKNIYRRQGSAVGVCLGAHVQAGQAEWVWIRILWLVTVIVSTTPDWFLHQLSHHHHPASQHKNISLSSDTKLFVVMWYKIICCEERTKVFVSCFPVSATFSFNWKLCVVKSRIMSTTVKAGSSGSGRQGFKHSIKMSYDEGRNTLRRMGRKISKLDTSDLDAQTITKIGTFFLGFLIFFYSLQIFFMLLPILYPAYQTIKVLQVLNSIDLKLFFIPWSLFRLTKTVIKKDGWGTGSSTVHCRWWSHFSSSPGCCLSTL